MKQHYANYNPIKSSADIMMFSSDFKAEHKSTTGNLIMRKTCTSVRPYTLCTTV